MPLLGQNFSLIKEQENIIDKLVPSFFIYINKHEWYSQDRDLEDSEMVKQARKKKRCFSWYAEEFCQGCLEMKHFSLNYLLRPWPLWPLDINSQRDVCGVAADLLSFGWYKLARKWVFWEFLLTMTQTIKSEILRVEVTANNNSQKKDESSRGVESEAT